MLTMPSVVPSRQGHKACHVGGHGRAAATDQRVKWQPSPLFRGRM